jgi:amino acid transporter
MGIELALVPSGEVKSPARTVPRSIFLALAITTAIYIAIQLVAQGVLGAALADFADAPLAEAASRFLGNAGRSILLAGAAISAFGYISGDILGSPRTLYAFGRNGVLPAKMAAVHPRFRTPHIAIAVHAIIAFALAVSGTFQYLALLSNIAALLLYLFCCAAAFELIRRNVRSDGAPFSIPGEKVVPVLAVIIVLWILSHATIAEFSVAIGVLTVASLLFCFRQSASEKRSDVVWAAIGALAGGVIAFLLRPSVLGQQLPFMDVITRGTTLTGVERFAVPLAETSFNFLMAGTFVGLLVGWGAYHLIRRTTVGSVDK